MKTLEETREFFKDDIFATDAGCVIDEVGEGYAVCSMTIEAKHKNARGGVMGGAIFTLADFAFAALTNGRENVTVAQQVSINFLSAPKGSRLFAKAVYRKNGRSSCVVTVEVGDDTGRDIALFTGTGFKMKQG